MLEMYLLDFNVELSYQACMRTGQRKVRRERPRRLAQ